MRMSNDMDSLIRVRRSTSGVDEWSWSESVVSVIPPVCNNDIEASVLYVCVFAVYSVNDNQVKLSIRIQEK